LFVLPVYFSFFVFVSYIAFFPSLLCFVFVVHIFPLIPFFGSSLTSILRFPPSLIRFVLFLVFYFIYLFLFLFFIFCFLSRIFLSFSLIVFLADVYFLSHISNVVLSVPLHFLCSVLHFLSRFSFRRTFQPSVVIFVFPFLSYLFLFLSSFSHFVGTFCRLYPNLFALLVPYFFVVLSCSLFFPLSLSLISAVSYFFLS